MILLPNKHKYSGIDNNALRGKRDIRLEPLRKDKVLSTVDHKFNPEIHEMVKNPNGKGYFQRLKQIK